MPAIYGSAGGGADRGPAGPEPGRYRTPVEAADLPVGRTPVRRTPMVLLVLALLAAPALARSPELSEEHARWLDDVRPLLSKTARKAFLALTQEYQREAFIAAFWAARDPSPETPHNEERQRYYERLEEARERFGDDWEDQRAAVWALNGEPNDVMATDCGVLTWPLELWTYRHAGYLGRPVEILFYQQYGGGPFRLWNPAEGYKVLLPTAGPTNPNNKAGFRRVMMLYCAELWDDTFDLLVAIRRIERDQGISSALAAGPLETEDPEWLLAFHAVSTDAPEDAEPLAAELTVRFPEPYRQRTVAQGVLSVPREAGAPVAVGDRSSYSFELTGEVLRGEELFESFRYRFEVPEERLRGDTVPLVFERYLRPGAYTWIVKLEDLGSGRVFREERAVEVPLLDGLEEAAELPGEVAAAVEETLAAGAGEAASIRFVGRQEREATEGLQRFEAAVRGDGVDKVAFFLDGRQILAKTRPPYGVELDLGRLPRRHTVRVVALAPDGEELATDEIVVNPGRHALRVRWVEPRPGGAVPGPVRARVEVEAPEGERVETVELYRADERLVTLFHEPWVFPLEIPADATYLRAVATLEDGTTAEDLLLVASADFSEELEVRLVEVFSTVTDSSGRPVRDLGATDFRVSESGRPQELLRFERLEDLPLHTTLLVDTSASMAEHLAQVRTIAQGFFEATLRPRDRASVMTFAERPREATPFTADLDAISAGLASLVAGRGTALWDSVVHAVYGLQGATGQRALVLLSDGEDRRSRFDAEEAARYATSAGVTVYAIALKSGTTRGGRSGLARLAELTGGRLFLLDAPADLAAATTAIQQDLRSRYLLVYQAPEGGDDDFREIDVQVTRAGLSVRALRGYFP